MKFRYLLAAVSVAFGLRSLACSSGDDFINMGSDGGGSSAGTKAHGGSDTGIGGDKPIGGGSSGGSSNGGKGGGGTASGGSASGGGSTSSMGGDGSSGDAGAPSVTCEQDADCVGCGYPTAPANDQECYCVTYCAPTSMSKTQCSANQAQFEKVCADVHFPCPAIKCLPTPDPMCSSHMCVAK